MLHMVTIPRKNSRFPLPMRKRYATVIIFIQMRGKSTYNDTQVLSPAPLKLYLTLEKIKQSTDYNWIRNYETIFLSVPDMKLALIYLPDSGGQDTPVAHVKQITRKIGLKRKRTIVSTHPVGPHRVWRLPTSVRDHPLTI